MEIKQAFPGGDSAWVKSVEETLNQHFKVQGRIRKGKYIVEVSFVIDREGHVANLQCESKSRTDMVKEVIRVVMKMSGRWRPAVSKWVVKDTTGRH